MPETRATPGAGAAPAAAPTAALIRFVVAACSFRKSWRERFVENERRRKTNDARVPKSLPRALENARPER
jgi:hypothetical protein